MISPNHPRASSLLIREKLIAGLEYGMTSYNGLLAHGRGEAFDYLIGEQTSTFAKSAIEVAAQLLVAEFLMRSQLSRVCVLWAFFIHGIYF